MLAWAHSYLSRITWLGFATTVFASTAQGETSYKVLQEIQKLTHRTLPCVELLDQIDANLLPQATEFRLPEIAKRAIEKHPIYRHRQRLLEGRNIVFLEKWGNRPLRDETLGEQIQRAFVIEALKTILPQATFDKSSLEPNERSVSFQLWDSGEASPQGNLPIVEMAKTKAANNVWTGLRKISLRDFFGIPQGDFVVSLYLRKSLSDEGEESPGIKRIIRALDSAHPVDIIFLTRPGYSASAGEFFALSNEFTILNLSEIKAGIFQPGHRYVVVNNLLGKTPYLHRAADLSVIKGPVNLFESLSVGTKTIFFDNSKVLDGYDPSIFAQMSSTAVASGGIPVKDIGELRRLLPQILNSSVKIQDPSFTPMNGHSAFDLFLDNLDSLLGTIP